MWEAARIGRIDHLIREKFSHHKDDNFTITSKQAMSGTNGKGPRANPITVVDVANL